jgi:F-type H+-transporting ATPase subunit delta
VEEIAEVYARSLYEVAREHDKIDTVREQLGQFQDALRDDRELSIFFFSPYFSTEEKKEGLDKLLEGPDDTFRNFLELLIEKHRVPAIHRIRRAFDERWEEDHKVLPVQITSATELDEATVRGIGDRIGEQTSRKVQLTAEVDPDILGGIVLRVGNQILDASIRNRLEALRRQVAKGAA